MEAEKVPTERMATERKTGLERSVRTLRVRDAGLDLLRRAT